MLKIILEIKENRKIEIDEGIAIDTEIRVIEKGINATETEKKVSNLLKKKLNIEDKVQIENYSKTKKDEELIKELLAKILS